MTEEERIRIANSVADVAEAIERLGRLFREASETIVPALQQLRATLASPEMREVVEEVCPASRDGRHMYHRSAVHGDEACLRCGQIRGVDE